MIKIKTNYSLLFLLITSCCLFVAVPTKSQVPEIDVTLTWSTDIYTPFDYPGKALPIEGSIIEVAANIDSLGINPQELIYNWSLDGKFQESSSGQGRQVFRFNIGESATKERLIKVRVKKINGTLSGTLSSLSLKTHESEIALETNIPFKSSNFTKEYQISAEQEVKFFAQPYFFNIKDIKGLDYSWKLGGKIPYQANNNNPNILTLKVGEIGELVKQDLAVWVKNKNNPSEKAQTKVEITFLP